MTATTIPGQHVDIRLWTRPETVEPEAMRQLRNISSLPWTFKHVAVMPDVHYGKGATVGSVIAMRDAISPAAVGVDIGCGMTAVRTSLRAADLPDDLGRLRAKLEAAVPVGFGVHKATAFTGRDADDWDRFWRTFDELTPAVKGQANKALHQMGTLGGGNHFIEICLDTEDQVWIMLHSGSRGIGNLLAQHHIEVARRLAHNAALPDPDLAVFIAHTPQMAAYRHDLYWAQDYARRNRAVMLRLICDVLRADFPHIRFEEPISCHHNYVSEENHFGEDVLVTRKGAIRAGRGELGIIP
ncbi:MAG TPA: RtcB family protein, partial [Micromonosporaceae bacterium]|nr:RtcB family protein [Micromonosporaceae bacterium]